eukprot:UN07706
MVLPKKVFDAHSIRRPKVLFHKGRVLEDINFGKGMCKIQEHIQQYYLNKNTTVISSKPIDETKEEKQTKINR